MFLRYNPTNCATQNWTNAAESTNLYTYKQVYNRYNMHRGWMQGAMPSLQPKALRIKVYPALPNYAVLCISPCLVSWYPWLSLKTHWRKKKISFVDFKALLKSLIDLVGNTERQFDNCELKGNIESISCRTLAYLHICTLALSHTHKIFISDGSTCGQEV